MNYLTDKEMKALSDLIDVIHGDEYVPLIEAVEEADIRFYKASEFVDELEGYIETKRDGRHRMVRVKSEYPNITDPGQGMGLVRW